MSYIRHTSVTIGEGQPLESRTSWIIWKHSGGWHSSMSSEFFCMILSQAWPGRDVSYCCPLHAVCESLSSPSRTRAGELSAVFRLLAPLLLSGPQSSSGSCSWWRTCCYSWTPDRPNVAQWVRVASGFGRGKGLAKGKTAVVTMRARARGKVALSLCILQALGEIYWVKGVKRPQSQVLRN